MGAGPGIAPFSAALRQPSLSENEQVHFIYFLRKVSEAFWSCGFMQIDRSGRRLEGRVIYNSQALHMQKVKL